MLKHVYWSPCQCPKLQLKKNGGSSSKSNIALRKKKQYCHVA
uniref:Uncharacterized protein n=1 Tax=Arundo donax TaxID=35708 RepID=A0A0A9GYZ9_ARUDO